MDYIKLIPEYIEPEYKYNIVSCVLFRLPKVYKNELKYYNGLKLLVDIFPKIFPKFYLRLYYDESVLNNKSVTDPIFIENTQKYWKPLFDNNRQKKYIQFCKFEIKDFKIDEYNHNGVISTIIRFCPLLNIKDNKNILDVICSDIDCSFRDYEDLKYFYNNLKQSKRDFFYKSRYCYFLHNRFKVVSKYYDEIIITNPIMAGTIISSIKIDENLFKIFFECVLDYDKKTCNRYKDFFTEGEDGNHDKKKIKYGIDELFTLDLLKYLLENKYKLVVHKERDIEKLIYNLYSNYKDKKLSDNRFNKIIKFMLGNQYDKSKSIQENYDALDKIIYSNKYKHVKTYINFIFRLKKLINVLTEKNQLHKYNIDKHDIFCVKNHDTKDKNIFIN